MVGWVHNSFHNTNELKIGFWNRLIHLICLGIFLGGALKRDLYSCVHVNLKILIFSLILTSIPLLLFSVHNSIFKIMSHSWEYLLIIPGLHLN